VTTNPVSPSSLSQTVDQAIEGAIQGLIQQVTQQAITTIVAQVTDAVTVWAQDWIEDHSAPPASTATGYTFSIQLNTGGNKEMGTTFTVDTTDGVADVQFVDQDNDPVEGPLDSVTGAPVVPTFTSDNTSVLTVGTATEDSSKPGHWTAPLAEAGAGTANVAPAPLTNSDGSPVNETVGPNAGQPFETAAAIAVTVNPGAAAGEVFSVGG
jgi:hypothetical protein